MACGCKKKKKKVPAPPPAVPMAAGGPVDVNSFAMSYTPVAEQIINARCGNCVGLLRTRDGKYLPMNTGEFFQVLNTDAQRWREEGWAIEVRQ